MTRVELRRLDDGFPPKRELLFVEDDGSFRMWRSNAEVVGRFAGALPDPAAFADLVAAAASTEPPAGQPTAVPDAVEDELRVGDRSLTTRPTDASSGPWGALLGSARALLGSLLDQPAAAIRLDVPDATTARLVHAGTDVLPIELGSLTASAEVYREATRLGVAAPEPPDEHHVDAGPGWSIELAIPPLDVPPDAELVIRIRFVVDDEGVMVPVELGQAWHPG